MREVSLGDLRDQIAPRGLTASHLVGSVSLLGNSLGRLVLLLTILVKEEVVVGANRLRKDLIQLA